MKLRYNISENKGENVGKEREEGPEKKESRFRKFCSHLWDATKVTTQVLAVVTSMTVLAYGCGNRPQNTGDADADQVETVDGETDEIGDVPEDEEIEPNCVEESEALEGEVNPLLANTSNGSITLNSSDSEVLGDNELTVGAEVSDAVVLGICPDDPDSVAAFGAQDANVGVTPQYRSDFGQTTFDAEMPDVEESVCPPPETDSIPVSMFIDETNIVVKAATVGTIDTRAEFGFITPLSPVILVDGAEAASPVLLDGSGYSVKALMIRVDTPLLEMATAVHSEIGDVVLEREVSGSADTADSKTLRIYQVGSEDSILPTVNWNPEVGYTLCLRSETGGPKSLDIEFDGEVIAEIVDSCGEIFSGFDVDSLNVRIAVFNPPHLASNYSVTSSLGTGVNSMEDLNASISATFRREVVVPDMMGESIVMEIAVEGRIVSREDNPLTGTVDSVSFTLPVIYVTDPDVTTYESICGYTPSGF